MRVDPAPGDSTQARHRGRSVEREEGRGEMEGKPVEVGLVGRASDRR